MSSPIVRDFTSAKREELVNAIEDSAQAAREDYEREARELVAFYNRSGLYQTISLDDVDTPQRCINEIQNLKNEAINNINRIFLEVNNADVEYVTRFESILNRLDAYLNTLTRLENLINPSMPGACPIGAPFLFMEQLAGIGNGMMDYWVNQLMEVSEDGSDGIQYSWSMLEEWMQIDPNELSTTQMAALVFTYLSMEDPDDIARLVGAGYHLIIIHEPHNNHLGYVQTEMMRALTEAVTVVVEPLAMATVWADPAIRDPVIEQCVRNMQALHVMSEVANTITTIPHHALRRMAEAGEYSETPIRLTVNDDGVWYIQYAVYDEGGAYGATPQFAMTAAEPLGLRRTSMAIPERADEQGDFHYANLVTGGSVGELIAKESLDAVRDMAIGAFFSSAISNATRATLASSGVGVILNVISDYAEAIEQRNAAMSFLDEGSLYRGIDYLGGRICFTPIGGVNVVHGINLQTRAAILRTTGFLYTYNYEITVEQLHMIILNGNQNLSASTIEGIGVDAVIQEAIWNDFQDYIDSDDAGSLTYRREVRRTAVEMRGEITDLFGVAYDVDSVVFGDDVEVLDWPAEVLTIVIERLNNPNPAAQAIT